MIYKCFSTLDKYCRFLEEWSLFAAVSVALLTAMANVILRKLTSDMNLYWSDEVVRKVIFFSTYIGAVAAIRTRTMVKIDALPQMLPVLKKPLSFVAHVATLGFSVVMIYLGWQMTVMMYNDQYARTSTLQLPEYFFYAILPLMGLMMTIRTMIIIYEEWTGVRLDKGGR